MGRNEAKLCGKASAQRCFGELFCYTKTEYRTNPSWGAPEEARKQTFEYIEVFYNRQRLYSAIGNVSLIEYEKRYFNGEHFSKNKTGVALCA